MPFKPVEHPKCPKCGKSVYAAEERVAGGLKWHKMCFKCGLCSKLLDSTNCSEHEGELFCKNCHGRKFGPKGYGFGGGAGCLSMDQGEHLKSSDERISNAVMESRAIAKAPEGQGCPRCGGYVYAAEQMLARGRLAIRRNLAREVLATPVSCSLGCSAILTTRVMLHLIQPLLILQVLKPLLEKDALGAVVLFLLLNKS
ncbi:muscle LIM protein Mlp84B-like isoform X4 [Leptopilina boulardi]|uniref:muscle LIM protein Mlp84B-like isoform X4 n=1 Tax=Leptopilina boulardi TaxID=63433 RepID=UPI0021F6695C|nr:muscle LIM protein Mlp84B-like isoform X4 [Leptopilina boulardi]